MTEPNPDSAVDPTALLRSKMAEQRRKRENSRSTASKTRSLLKQERPSSQSHATDGQTWKEDETIRDELAGVRSEMQVMRKQRQEDSNMMRDMLQDFAKLKEELAKHTSQQIYVPQQSFEQNSKQETNRIIFNPKEGDRMEIAASPVTASPTSPVAPLSLPSQALGSTPASGSNPRASAPLASEPSALTPPLPLQPQIAQVPNKEPHQTKQDWKQQGWRHIRAPKKGTTLRRHTPGLKTTPGPRRPGPSVKRNESRHEIWLESERKVVFDVVREARRQDPKTYPRHNVIVQAYNDRLRGVVQRAGEETLSSMMLMTDRKAPIRTRGGISMLMRKYGLLSCQQIGGFRYAEGARRRREMGVDT